jgi:hypothetical protein
VALFTNYDQVGKKESVADKITNLSPTKTPFTSTIGTEKITNTLHQWQEDSLRAVGVNAQVEGFDAVDGTLAATVMRNNVTQIFSETIKVSGTADAVDTYGRAKETAYQLSKASAQVKRDLENAFVGINQAAVNTNAATARKTASVFAQIDSSMLVKTGATNTPLSEANLLTSLQKAWTEGAEPTTAMVTADDSLVVADFAKASGRNREINNGTADRKIVNVVDLYVSPFGEVGVQLNRFLMPGKTLVYEADMWKRLILRDWFRETLAKTGDNTKMMIVGEFGLKHKNYKASAYISREA